MMEIKLRVSDEVREEAERGRIAHHFPTLQEYVTALILDGAGRVSGLGAAGAFTTAATDHRVSSRIADALACIQSGNTDAATDHLLAAQGVILESLVQKKAAVENAVDERIRIRGGGDDWSEKP